MPAARPSGDDRSRRMVYNCAVKLLALDTSTEFLSLALWLDGRLSTRDLRVGQKHSEQTLPLLRELLDEAGIALADLDGIAFGNGPGSFTGLRIGCGIVQGLAFAHGLPVVGVSSLLALAESDGHERVISCLDARMNQVYFAAYQRAGHGWQTIVEPGLYDPDATPPLPGDGWHGSGSGFAAFPALAQRYAGQMPGCNDGSHPEAAAIAALGAREFEAGRGLPARDATLLYVRDKVALTVHEQPRK